MSTISPAPQRSLWPWRGRSRRRNSESSVASPTTVISPGRNSLSAVDAKGAEGIRTKAAEFLASYRAVGRRSIDQDRQDMDAVGAAASRNPSRRKHSR